jgi:hypothetical protein
MKFTDVSDLELILLQSSKILFQKIINSTTNVMIQKDNSN